MAKKGKVKKTLLTKFLIKLILTMIAYPSMV